MKSGGLIIRLIDVVLIILLGFLNISDFMLKAQIKLDTGNSETQEETQSHLYFLNVMPEGEYTVEDTEIERTLLFSIVKQENEEMNDLERFLVGEFYKNNANNIDMVLVIKSDPETKIQHTIDVLDICEKYKIPRTVSY